MKAWRLLFVLALAAAAQQVLSNDDVVKMIKSGISEDVVLSMVKTQPAQYTLTPDELIALKSAGVPNRVVAAMVEKSAGGNVPISGKATGATPVAGTVAKGD